MRKTLALAAGFIALFGLSSLATAQAPQQDWHGSLTFFFGECDPNEDLSVDQISANLFSGGCSGIGMFWGDWDENTLPVGINAAAADRFGGNWRVTHLTGYDLVGREGTIGGGEYSEYPCGAPDSEPVFTFGHIAFWIAWFDVEPCIPEPVLLCFDGESTGEYNGVCTVTGPRSATLNAIDQDTDPNNNYAGVYFDTSPQAGSLIGNATNFSFDYNGTGAVGGSPRLTIPIDTSGDGLFDVYTSIDTVGCNDGDANVGTLDVINDATCTISHNQGAESFVNWAAYVAAHPAYMIATNEVPFIIVDQPGNFTITNIHLGN